MHKFIAPMLAATFMAAATAMSTPAAAVEGEAAASACEKRPKHCTVDYGNGGDLVINVCNDGQGCRTINCPPKGACVFAAPKGGKPTRATGTVEGILKASGPGMAKTPTTPTKITEDKKKIGTTQVKERQSSPTTGTDGSKKH